MASEDSGLEDRTEEASAHRREEWRKEGKVFQSRELVSALIVLGTTGVFFLATQWSLPGLWQVFTSSLHEVERLGTKDWTTETIMVIGRSLFYHMALIVAPFVFASFVVGVGSSLLQTGFVWSTKGLEMDLEKINPITGFQRIVSMDGVVELIKAIIKFTIIALVTFVFLKNRIGSSGSLFTLEASSLAVYAGRNSVSLLFSVGLAMLVVSAMDYGYQRFRYEQKIRMTKQEVKEERRQLEGNPQIKARIRSLQRRIAQNKMLEDVKKADVVVTNPTHIAVALIYDRENMLAPRVVAKGADYMAERIKKIARENGIPCVENVPLARAMYKALKIGQIISRDLYNAVAEVLAYVYRLKGRSFA